MAEYKYNPLLKKNLQIDDSTEGNPIPSSDIVISDDIDFVLLPGNSFGNLTGSGTIASGTSLQTLLENALVGYLVPTFSSFSLDYPSATLEIGTDVGSPRTATWGTTNPTNVAPNSVNIFNTTGSSSMVIGTGNDGTESVTVNSGIITSAGWVFTIIATNTALPVPSTFQRTYSLAGRYRYFHGAVATIPTDSAGVRALPVNTQFAITSGVGADSITLNTGINPLLLNFTFAIPAGKTLVSVIDLDAANANITGSYILATFDVNDANTIPTPVAYEIYSLTVAIAYGTNHRHQITLS